MKARRRQVDRVMREMNKEEGKWIGDGRLHTS